MESKTSVAVFSCLVLLASGASLQAEGMLAWRLSGGAASVAVAGGSAPSPVSDPAGDTFPTSGEALDIAEVSATYDPTHLHFTVTFHTPIAPASSGQPNALIGQIEFDTDQSASTGIAPLQNAVGPPASSLDAGIDYILQLTSNLANPGMGNMVNASGNVVGTVELTFFTQSVSGSIPLSLLGGDDGVVDYTTIIGNFSSPTDAMDVLGQSVPVAVNTFTITDGHCEFRLNNLMGQRSSTNGGLSDLIVNALENSFQTWFWYRATGDTREYALANQVAAEVTGNHARLLYSEPIGDGNRADAVLFDLEYTLTDLGADRGAEPPACGRCEMVIAANVRNRLDQPVDVALFSYNDMDIANGASGDFAMTAGDDTQAHLLYQASAYLGLFGAVYKVSSTGHIGWEIAAYPAIRSSLTDADVDDLANTGAPFGPGDYAGAQQWYLQLAPAGSLSPPDAWTGSVVQEVTVFLDGDADGDCDVDLIDHAIFQGSLTGPLP